LLPFTFTIAPSARLLKVPAIGLALMLSIAVKTVPDVSVPDPIPIKEKSAPLFPGPPGGAPDVAAQVRVAQSPGD
jgi:hypothetical protein